jgi:hypothetical protein
MSDQLEAQLLKAKLPEAACERLRLAFRDNDNGLREAIHVEQRLTQHPHNPMRRVTVNLVACGEAFKAIIFVRADEYFHDGVLLESKLRNRLSCNMSVFFPSDSNISESMG